jgi:thioredoxin reductase
MNKFQAHPSNYQVVIVGAGPAGLQLGYFLDRAGIDYLVLERNGGPGSFFDRLPVHRTLLSVNKTNTGYDDPAKNLRWDWNSLLSDQPDLRLSQYDREFFPQADSLVRYLQSFQTRTGTRVRFNCEVRTVVRRNPGFILNTSDGDEIACTLLVVATGTPLPYTPDIQGIELAEQYVTHDRTPEASANREILIIGKGNSAFETAAALLPHAARIHLIGPRVLRMAWRTHYPGDLRQINSPFLETFYLKLQNAVLNGTIMRVERSGERFSVAIRWSENGNVAQHSYDRVIVCTGFRIDVSPFNADCTPDLAHEGRLPALTCRWESTNVPDLYFAGVLMHSSDYKKSASSFIHGIRYNCQCLSQLVIARLNNTEYPFDRISRDPTQVEARIQKRIRTSDSLWHLYGSLCDCYIVDDSRGEIRYLRDVPVRMMAEDPTYRLTSRIELRFTFKNPEDPVERVKFTPSGLLHPALYFFVRGKLVGECHKYEDIYAEWDEKDGFGPDYLLALQAFLEGLPAAEVMEPA